MMREEVPLAVTAWLTGRVELPHTEMRGARALGGKIIILRYIKFSGSHGAFSW